MHWGFTWLINASRYKLHNPKNQLAGGTGQTQTYEASCPNHRMTDYIVWAELLGGVPTQNMRHLDPAVYSRPRSLDPF